ncbi:MAG: hypothetical protein Q4A21_00525 [bacterium]|nr:hypothetical protein [bacterium]
MISKIIFIVTILSLGSIAWILNATTPSSLGPVGVLGLFILTYLFFVGIISFVAYGGFRAIQMVSSSFGDRVSIKSRNYRFFLQYSFILAFIPIILIAQQSSGGVGIFDIILLAIFQILSFIIVSKR